MLKANQVKRWFPDDDVMVVPDRAVTPRIVDATARTMLTKVGLPETFLDVVELDTGLQERIRTVDEVYRGYDERPPADGQDLFVLGNAGQPFLAVHGRTGAVFQVHDDFGVRPFASNLETFVRTLGFVSEEVRRHQRKGSDDAQQFRNRLRDETLRQLGRIDPAALPAAEPAWRAFLDDVAGNVAGT